MKIFLFAIALILISPITIHVFSQESTRITTEFKVLGVCDMCKVRIENAAYIKGVKYTNWNKETGMLNLVFNSKKTDLDIIQKSIANAGHSTEKLKAVPEAYAKLPKCCAYDDGVKVH